MANVNLDKVRAFIKDSGMKDQAFAEAMGIDYSYLFKVLRGSRSPGGKFIDGLISAGMKPNDIFYVPRLTNVKTGTD